VKLKDLSLKTHQLYFQNFSTFVGITVVPFFYDFLVGLSLTGMSGSSAMSTGFLLLHVAIIAPFIHFLSWVALTWAASEAYSGNDTSLISSYRMVFGRRFFKVVFTYGVMWIFISFGFLFFLIPGIILLVRYCLVPQVVIIGGLNGIKALRRSKDLIHNAFLKTLIFLILFTFIEGLIVTTLGFNDTLKYLVALLFTPFGTIFYTVYYYDRVESLRAGLTL
jgi:hypothetical protein